MFMNLLFIQLTPKYHTLGGRERSRERAPLDITMATRRRYGGHQRLRSCPPSAPLVPTAESASGHANYNLQREDNV